MPPRAGSRARRLLIRRLRGIAYPTGRLTDSAISDDLEPLYAALADRDGVLETGGEEAWRFAAEAAAEFDAVLWVPCFGLTQPKPRGNWERSLDSRSTAQRRRTARAS